ncbi:type I-E CRISPR-associated protein Cas5/CasD [Amycolatopsis orientalis]|uniref:Type I-E CRISPR-associated protein Cas5/CasD n=1 Tax=Amycolatopsis orientalis TaxID=31958 RepID=A0A193BYD6_AMYOR|nr:type I-E CRISPR-associated protein Cas5/CasD [Amycolatopsis orientalis]ANN17251.1 type I-E CRISPR-associated protein Cas5/CasD [Amycolatopsis orientalis]
MTATLALCFDAPMQSWGTRSRGIIRDTAREPTKSGVVGLLAAARGVERDDEDTIAELAALRLGVRVDREGLLERDYQTAQNVPTTHGSGHRTVVSERYYLADALFLVLLEGPETRLAQLRDAIITPQWPLCFGRRAFVPARPLVCCLRNEPLDHVIRTHPWLEPPERVHEPDFDVGLRTILDGPADAAGAELRHDFPISFAHDDRRFATRTVVTGDTPLTPDMITTGVPSCS